WDRRSGTDEVARHHPDFPATASRSTRIPQVSQQCNSTLRQAEKQPPTCSDAFSAWTCRWAPLTFPPLKKTASGGSQEWLRTCLRGGTRIRRVRAGRCTGTVRV